MYEKFGSNTQKRILLVIARETAAQMKAKYEEYCWGDAIFPIVGSDGGSAKLWDNEYPYSSGVSYMIHLTRKYEKLPQKYPDSFGIEFGMNKASSCCQTHVCESLSRPVVTGNSISLTYNKLMLTVAKRGLYKISIFSYSGRCVVLAQNLLYTSGKNSFNIENMAPGSYLVCLEGVSGSFTSRISILTFRNTMHFTSER